ncbi:MAG: hypothetical protein QOE99_691 [Actinomycetota bacterium]|jgi:hypothetical protein|nr:hypothetical protein [Actinomycetota bacterium]
MDADAAALAQEGAVPQQDRGVERRRKDVVCVSCPSCSGAVPVQARCIDGDVEPVLECRTCGWVRRARQSDVTG